MKLPHYFLVWKKYMYYQFRKFSYQAQKYKFNLHLISFEIPFNLVECQVHAWEKHKSYELQRISIEQNTPCAFVKSDLPPNL